MADKQIIAATLQVDTGSSNANIKEVNKSLSDVKTSLKDTGTTAANTSKQVQESGESFGKLKEQMTALPGPLGQAGEGVNKLSSTFKALLANPVVLIITAIIAVLALLYKAFTNSFEGGQKMEQVFAGIKAVGQSLIDNITKIVGAIGKLLTLDFSGAIKDLKGVVNEAGAAYNAMAELTKQAQGLHKEQLQNDLDQAVRAKKLAQLREEATDETIPIAKRKAALKELQADAQADAKNDLELAKKVTANKIAQLTIQKDGALKNRDEINKLKVDQINVETDSANELRRIGKQLTAADKAEKAERTAADKEATEKAKARRQELVDFTNKLTGIQQENELLLLKDGYDKELKLLQNKIAADKRANALSFQDKKITKEQQTELDAALDIQFSEKKAALDKKNNEEKAKKEADFQKELASITGKTRLDAIKDQRVMERVQLQIGYEEKLQDAIIRYKDDAIKFQQIKQALDAQLKAEQDKLDEKFAKEDAKKKFEADAAKLNGVINSNDLAANPLVAKKAALDAEQLLVQQAFDTKVISEQDYNTKVAEFANKRKEISDLEVAQKKAEVQSVTDLLGVLAGIIGKQTIAGKAIGIATALINTYQGASEALKQKSTLPSPFDVIAKVAAVATVIATGIATVKSIASVQVPAGGSGGASIPGTSLPSAPIAPTQASTKIDQASIAGIGDATSGRAYVISSDIASDADRNARLNRAARLGE